MLHDFPAGSLQPAGHEQEVPEPAGRLQQLGKVRLLTRVPSSYLVKNLSPC